MGLGGRQGHGRGLIVAHFVVIPCEAFSERRAGMGLRVHGRPSTRLLRVITLQANLGFQRTDLIEADDLHCRVIEGQDRQPVHEVEELMRWIMLENDPFSCVDEELGERVIELWGVHWAEARVWPLAGTVGLDQWNPPHPARDATVAQGWRVQVRIGVRVAQLCTQLPVAVGCGGAPPVSQACPNRGSNSCL